VALCGQPALIPSFTFHREGEVTTVASDDGCPAWLDVEEVRAGLSKTYSV